MLTCFKFKVYHLLIFFTPRPLCNHTKEFNCVSREEKSFSFENCEESFLCQKKKKVGVDQCDKNIRLCRFFFIENLSDYAEKELVIEEK